MKINDFIKKWENSGIEDFGSQTSPSYRRFESQYKGILLDICDNINFDLHNFHRNHYEFSAVLKNKCNNKFYYISISDVRYFPSQWHDNILYRTMAHDKDWHGGTNNYSSLDNLQENLVRLDKFNKN